MYEHALPIQCVSEETENPSSREKITDLLVKEYQYWDNCLAIQPDREKVLICLQGMKLAKALSNGMEKVAITFPDALVFTISGNGQKETKRLVLSEAGKTITWHKKRRWFTRKTFLQTIQDQIELLESSLNPASAVFGGLLRFAVARSLIYESIPTGKEVIYSARPGEDIPSVPQSRETRSHEPILSGGSYTNCFYLPQWVAFDGEGQLVIDSVDEAESYVALLQNYLGIIYDAVTLAPYMVVDQVYRQKYYGILGQFVNQSRALCRFRTKEIIATIRRRSSFNSLNRGLSITMPFFDDRAMVLQKLEFEIIPPGRVMFIPAFVIMAVQEQLTMVRHNTVLNFSTRKHLLDQLEMLLKAFDGEMK